MAKSKRYDGKIPFDKDGNLLHYTWDGSAQWRDNCEALMTLTFTGFQRGRSAAYAVFNCGGLYYPMFLKDLEKVLQNKMLDKGSVCARFQFCKRGQNYGIQLAE
jgi:hypothetical protein